MSSTPPHGTRPPRPGEVEGADPDDSMIVAASDRGHIGRDDRGQAQWKWASEATGPSDPNADTFDFLKAIDNWELAIEEGQTDATAEIDLTGAYNPYEKPK